MRLSPRSWTRDGEDHGLHLTGKEVSRVVPSGSPLCEKVAMPSLSKLAPEMSAR
jgi:hypothetical protein